MVTKTTQSTGCVRPNPRRERQLQGVARETNLAIVRALGIGAAADYFYN
jgi:hypothetical protein